VAFGIGFLGLLFLSAAGPASLLPLSSTASEGIYQVVLPLFALLVLAIATRSRWTESVYVSAAALTLFVGIRFVDWFWDVMPRFVFFLLLAAVAFGWLLMLRRLRTRLHDQQHSAHSRRTTGR
jgi:hypothetical protein